MNELSLEYEALRREMMHRVQTIHQTLLTGVGAALGAIAFGLTTLPQSVGVHESQLSCLIQMLLILFAFYLLEQHWVLYRIGTYIAFSYEGNEASCPRWHRMSRHYGDWQKKAGRRRLLWDRWGSGSRLAGWTICVLTIANTAALVSLKSQWVGLNSAALSFETLAVILAAVTLIPAVSLLCGLKGYRDRLEKDWLQYHAEFHSSEFASRYATKSATDTGRTFEKL